MTDRKIKISYDSPLYLQVKNLIESRINDRAYLPGTSIPSSSDIADILGVNRLTVEAALERLVGEGTIKRIQGKGTYVVGEKISRDLERLQGFTQTMQGKHVKYSNKVLKKYRRRVGNFFGYEFDIDKEDYIYYIERLCYVDKTVVSIEEIYVVDELVPRLDGIDLSVFSLYEVYEFYGIKLKEAKQTLELVYLNKREAKLLDLNENDSALMVICKTFDVQNRLIEISKNVTRSDSCDYTVHFKKLEEV